MARILRVERTVIRNLLRLKIIVLLQLTAMARYLHLAITNELRRLKHFCQQQQQKNLHVTIKVLG